MTTILNADGKREEVDGIIRTLHNAQSGLSAKRLLSLLQRLKILGRETRDADAIFTDQGIEALCHFALDRSNVYASREALGCLANATLLRAYTRQVIVDCGYAPRVVALYKDACYRTFYQGLKVVASEDIFLCARLLLMLTDRTNLDFGMLIVDHGLADAINQAISTYAQDSCPGDLAERPGAPIEAMALSETLKLLYSTMSHHQNQCKQFKPAISLLVHILTRMTPENVQSLDPPVNHIVNALFKLEVSKDDASVLFPRDEPQRLVRLLIKLLDQTLEKCPASALDVAAVPILGLFIELYELGPEGVKQVLKEKLLPSDSERDLPLGQTNTLPARLLRLSASGQNPELREVIPVVLFALSNRDAEIFVHNVGYGFASGFLTNNRIPYTPRQNGAIGKAQGASDVNLVTGQYLAHEPRSEQPAMSEEEKMREAERLFVLFERLKKTGVMDVKNPVEEAVQSGRFEELE